MAKETKDKTKSHLNSQAPAIKYPEEALKKHAQTSEDPTGSGMKVRKETREIEFHFTDKEIQDKGVKLAKCIKEKASIEDELKSIKADYTAKIGAKQTEIDTITEQISNGHEIRTVTVEVRRNFETGKREYWYKGEKRGEEPLTAKDHQMDIDDAIDSSIKEAPVVPFKINAGDFVVTKKGKVVEITEEDVVNGIQYKSIDRLATQEEINEHQQKR